MNSAKIFSNNNKNLLQKFLTLSPIHLGKMPGTKRKSDGSPAKPNYEYWLIKSEPESRIEKGEKQNLVLDDLFNSFITLISSF